MHEFADPRNTNLSAEDCAKAKNPLLTNTADKCEPMPKGDGKK